MYVWSCYFTVQFLRLRKLAKVNFRIDKGLLQKILELILSVVHSLSSVALLSIPQEHIPLLRPL